MTQEHPITPPPALVQQWLGEYFGTTVSGEVSDVELALATRAARWGADQELEACCEWFLLEGWHPDHPNKLRAARRPKPPNLKEQALGALYAIATGADDTREFHQDLETIKTALESLPD
jgi:hypothetical protein